MICFQVRLEADGSPSERKKYARLPPPVDNRPYILRFVITAGSPSVVPDVALVTNHPAMKGKPFVRNQYQRIAFEFDEISDATAEIQITTAGGFEYFVEYSLDGETCRAKSGFVVVDPRLSVPLRRKFNADVDMEELSIKDNESILLPLDAICLLTVIPKWLPVIPKWPEHFESFAKAGYNMIHYAPLNARGASNSPYSIYDQLSISNDLFDKALDETVKEQILKEMLQLAHSEYGILSITDIVWNHTAHNSLWLEDHPEAGYNLETAPHLRPAYELDEAIVHLKTDLLDSSISLTLKSEEDLTRVMHCFKDVALRRLKLWEFYVIDVEESVSAFKRGWSSLEDKNSIPDISLVSSGLKQWAAVLKDCAMNHNTPLGKRFNKKLDIAASVEFMKKLVPGTATEDQAAKTYTDVLNEINDPLYAEANSDMDIIVQNVWNRARYLRLADGGPKLGPISEIDPLVDTYFTRLPLNSRTNKYHPDSLSLANNGWIWNGNPLENFAGPTSKSYLLREVIPWGDCVKLRYGDCPESNPWLWEHQKQYTEKMASLFHGFRIDNCHSTPLNVAEYLLDAARVVNPNLYVFAELFTGSEEKDILFVSKLGINSLIREAMSAWDPQELSRLVHRYGGTPIGSLTSKEEYFPNDILGHSMESTFFSTLSPDDSIVVDVKGSSPHALFMDCTHDNETPHQRRTAEDTLPTAALVAMTSCAVGSVKGYDEIVPELLNVVSETRKYRPAEEYEGIIPAKSILLDTHAKMAREGYTEIHVNQEHDFISVHRVHPVTHDGFLLVARCAFRTEHGREAHSPIVLQNQKVHIVESAGLRVQAHINHHHTGAIPSLEDEASHMLPTSAFGPHDSAAIAHARDERARIRGRKTIGVISGLPCFLDFSAVLTTLVNVEESTEYGNIRTTIRINPDSFLPGSIVLFRTWMDGSGMQLVVPDSLMSPLPSPMRKAASLTRGNDIGGNGGSPMLLKKLIPSTQKKTILGNGVGVVVSHSDLGQIELLWKLLGFDDRNFVARIMFFMGRDMIDCSESPFGLEPSEWPPGLWESVSNLGAGDINIILYRCASEERDTIGDGAYNIPGHGELSYCGLQGFMSVIFKVARNNELNHPICSNLRAGRWMLDYTTGRLRKYSKFNPNVLKLTEWFEDRFSIIKNLSSSFVPKYFFMTVFLAYAAVRKVAISRSRGKIVKLLNEKCVSSLTRLVESLCMTTYQFTGAVPSTGLSPSGRHPDLSEKQNPSRLCLAAGLPHFASHHMRCWGRDIFLSLPGLYLIPGHFELARSHLIAFASTLRHGLIPNLLDQGNFPRYNARDASWWWLWSVQQYCATSPEGHDFLNVNIARRFPPLLRYRKGPSFLKVEDSEDSDGVDTYVPPDDSRAYLFHSTVGELCFEILERHARGINFKEWNAGSSLDHAMKDEGFTISIYTDFENDTGLVFGGNRFNCGTWMDKMGDSEKAGTKGYPATPRDGCAVEIVGLLKATLNWMVKLLSSSNCSYFPADGVMLAGKKRYVKFSEWNAMLEASFERNFFIPKDTKDDGNYNLDNVKEFVNLREIYRDTVGSSQAYMDVQLRPNFLVPMVVAPELFDRKHALAALAVVEKELLGPLGMRTLYSRDWSFRGIYDNSNDSDDAHVAHGYNYHNGPEWGWLVGYFLRARFEFRNQDGKHAKEYNSWFHRNVFRQKAYVQHLDVNPFAGLPELTNQDGEFCSGSCPTQAWSSATLLEAVVEATT